MKLRTALMFTLALPIVLLLAMRPPTIGDSTACSNVSVPDCPGSTGCSAKVTAEEVVAPEGTCGAAATRVKVTIVITCGSTSCTRTFFVCFGSVAPLEFFCDGVRRRLFLNSGTWGGLVEGTGKCSDLRFGCS